MTPDHESGRPPSGRQPGDHLQYLLTAYLFGDLSAAGKAEVEGHLKDCARCRDELAGLRATLGLAEKVLLEDRPEYFFDDRRRARVLAGARQARHGFLARLGIPILPRFNSRWARVAALLLVLLTGGLVLISALSGSRKQAYKSPGSYGYYEQRATGATPAKADAYKYDTVKSADEKKPETSRELKKEDAQAALPIEIPKPVFIGTPKAPPAGVRLEPSSQKAPAEQAKPAEPAQVLASEHEKRPSDPLSTVASDLVVPPDVQAKARLGDHWETNTPDRPDIGSAFGNPDAGVFYSETSKDSRTTTVIKDAPNLDDVIDARSGRSPGTGGGFGGGGPLTGRGWHEGERTAKGSQDGQTVGGTLHGGTTPATPPPPPAKPGIRDDIENRKFTIDGLDGMAWARPAELEKNNWAKLPPADPEKNTPANQPAGVTLPEPGLARNDGSPKYQFLSGREQVDAPKRTIRRSGGSCFPAGTLVQTGDGPRAIETIAAGARVLACDPRSGEWADKAVIQPLRHEYRGDVVTFRVAGTEVEATGNHPFWVSSGADLAGRPAVADLPPAEQPDPVKGLSRTSCARSEGGSATGCGRWVEARALRIGDRLLLTGGRAATVERLETRQDALPVFNLTVTDWHTYAVSPLGILVHNKEESIQYEEVDVAGENGLAFKDKETLARGEKRELNGRWADEKSVQEFHWAYTGKDREKKPEESRGGEAKKPKDAEQAERSARDVEVAEATGRINLNAGDNLAKQLDKLVTVIKPPAEGKDAFLQSFDGDLDTKASQANGREQAVTAGGKVLKEKDALNALVEQEKQAEVHDVSDLTLGIKDLRGPDRAERAQAEKDAQIRRLQEDQVAAQKRARELLEQQQALTLNTGQARTPNELTELKKEIEDLRKEKSTNESVGKAGVDVIVDNRYGPNATVTTKAGKSTIGGLLQVWYYNADGERVLDEEATRRAQQEALAQNQQQAQTLNEMSRRHAETQESAQQNIDALQRQVAEMEKKLNAMALPTGAGKRLDEARAEHEGLPERQQELGDNNGAQHQDYLVYPKNWAEIAQRTGEPKNKKGKETVQQLYDSYVKDHRVFTSEPDQTQLEPEKSESLLRAFRFFQAENRRLDVDEFLRRPASIPAPPPTDEGLDEDAFIQKYGIRPFVDAARDHLSTFGLDVDTASYTRTRALLQQGQLPAPDTVRTEEFVNYFKQEYSVPGDETFAVFVEGMPAPFGAAGMDLVKIGIKSRDPRPDERKPACLTFVIDVSGSMARVDNSGQERVDLIRTALKSLIQALQPEDSVCLVTFNDQARLALPRTEARFASRILDALDRLEPGGATNVEAGLEMGYRMADEAYSKESINRVILCSDGVANVGAEGPAQMLKLVKTFAGRNIDLNTVGLGMGRYNDRVMQELADGGNGSYHFVNTPAEARAVFCEQLPPNLDTLARDAKLQVDFDPTVVKRYRLLGYEKRKIADADFRNDKIDSGEVAHSTLVTALYEIERQSGAHGSLGKIFLRWKDAALPGRPVVERNYPLSEGLIASTRESAGANLRFLACVAEFAELLRGSRWAQDGSYAAVLKELNRLPAEFRVKPEWSEVRSLVWKAHVLSMKEWLSSLKH